jgi:hypothetical protein
MNPPPRSLARGLQVVVGVLFAIWFAGALIGGLYHNYTQKRQCIHDEGWLKGWLWCSTETRNTFANNMLRGLIWPIDLAVSFRSSDEKASTAPKMTREDFGKSRVATIYSCWAVALRTKRDEDAKTAAEIISWIRKQDSIVDAKHREFMRFAGLHLQELESRKGFEPFYQVACIEPIANMRQAIGQGMMQ